MKTNFWIQLVACLPILVLGGNTTTPAGCKKLNTDMDWPTPDVWKAAMPSIIKGNGTSASPDYRIQATNAADVQAAVKFATEHNVRLTVITTGHDQLGRNDAGSGLIIDVSLLRGVRVLESFTPSATGAESPDFTVDEPNIVTPQAGIQAAVTFGPAVAGQALNYAVSPSGLFTVSGAAGTVGVGGGWGQNGGYGPLTAQYGLGVDQWLEAKIVTPDGELKVANAASNPDLFWAIRGGGGSTFGVVVEATWKAYPVIPMTGFNWYINSTLNATDYETGLTPMSAAMEYMFGELPGLQAKGISAYFYTSATTVRCYAIHPANESGIANANAVWGPILDKLQTFPGMTPYQTKPFEFKNYKEFFDITYGVLGSTPSTDNPRSHGIVPFESRLLSADNVQSPNLTYALRETRGSYGILLCAPGQAVGSGEETSANPGWRKATILLVGMKSASTNIDGLRKLAPDMGSYINEGSLNETNWTQAYWGDNYPKLSKIKSELDPNMTFWISPGVNADHMEAVDGRACLIENPSETPSLYPPPTEKYVAADLAVERDFLFGKTELIGATYPAPGTFIGLQPA